MPLKMSKIVRTAARLGRTCILSLRNDCIFVSLGFGGLGLVRLLYD